MMICEVETQKGAATGAFTLFDLGAQLVNLSALIGKARTGFSGTIVPMDVKSTTWESRRMAMNVYGA